MCLYGLKMGRKMAIKKNDKKSIEKIEAAPVFDPEIFENDFDVYLSEFCELYNIPDMSKETPHRWNAALIYINKHCINSKALKDNRPYYNQDNINNNIPDKFKYTDTKNRYNDDYLLSIAYIYINNCLLYNKIPSIYSYSLLVNIDSTYITQWQYLEPSCKRFNIYKNIMMASESTLSDELANGGANKIGVITRLNHQFAWATNAAAAGVTPQQQALQATELPKLGTLPDQ